MIKLFRNIRLKFWNQGKPEKYITYAVGEIALVMIGILLALQVNNWNEKKKANHLASQYLKNIIIDLEDQLVLLENQITSEIEFFTASKDLITDYHSNDKLILDSLFFERGTLIGARKTFIVNNPTFSDLISSGNVNILQEPRKKELILKYYQDLKRVDRILQNNNTNFVDEAYSSTYNQIGYFSIKAMEGFKSLYSEFQISEDLYNPSERLMKLSRDLMTDEKELELLNKVTQRHLISASNLNILRDVKNKTLILIEALTEKQ